MKHKVKRALCIVFVVLLAVMQLPNAITALADETALKVSDIGDENLYSALSVMTGNTSGKLFKEDLEGLNSLDFAESDISEYIRATESFTNLAKYCPNVKYISNTGNIKESAFGSFFDEIVMMKKLSSLHLYSNYMTQNQFNKLCDADCVGELNYISLSINASLDISNAANMTNLKSFSIDIYNEDTELTGLSLLKCENVFIYNNSATQSHVDGYIKDLNKNITSLGLSCYTYNSSTENALEVNVAAFTELMGLSLNGYFSEVKGIENATKLTSLSIRGYSSEKTELDITQIGNMLTNLQLENINLKNKGTSVSDLSFLPKTIGSVEIINCGISDASCLNDTDYGNIYSLNLSRNSLNKAPALKNAGTMNFSNNQITDISAFSFLKDVEMYEGGPSKNYYINLSNNQITNIDVFGQAKDCIYNLNLGYNQISELPDLTTLSKVVGTNWTDSNYRFADDDYYDLTLKGNNLEPEDITASKVPAAYASDKWFVYAATMKSINGTAYFETINSELVSKLTENNGGGNIYTHSKTFTIDTDVVKQLRKDKKILWIYYIDDQGNTDEYVRINGDSDGLTSDDAITVEFKGVAYDAYKTDIDNVFEPYGNVAFSITKPVYNEKVSGVQYSFSDNRKNLDPSKKYNVYYYNPENHKFVYTNSCFNTSYLYTNYYGGDDQATSRTYFVVETENDNLVGLDVVPYENGGYSSYIYYKVLDDTVFEGILDSNYMYTLKTTASQINISPVIADALIKANKTLYFNKYNPVTHENTMDITVNNSQLSTSENNVITIPTVSTDTTFAGVTDLFNHAASLKCFSVSSYDKNSAASFYYAIANGQSDAVNVYKYVDGVILPYIRNVSFYSTLGLSPEAKFISVLSSEDTYMGKAGDIFYDKDVSSEQILKMLKAYNTLYEGKGSLSIRTAEDKVNLSTEVLTYLKENEKTLNIYYIDPSDGHQIGYVNVSGKNRALSTDAVTVERPAVTLSTSNKEYEAMLPAGTSAVYVTAANHVVKGISYWYTDSNVLYEKFSTDNYNKITLNNGKLNVSYGSFSSGSIGVYDITYALVKQSEYATPSDTSTPTDVATPTDPKPVDPTPVDPTPTDPTPSVPDPTPVVQPTTETGVNSVAETIKEEEIVETNKVTEVLETVMETSSVARVETVTKEVAPVLTPAVFSKMKESQKDITVGVTDKDNKLQYSWSFDSDKISNADMNLDLSISFDTNKAEEIKEVTGRSNLMYVNFSHHGELPAPATIKTYVGDKYKNGDVISLYYFNEETNLPEAVAGGKGLKVEAGYVTYTITHCSIYFLSAEVPANLVDTTIDNGSGTPIADAPVAQIVESAQTGDTRNVLPYVLEAAFAMAVLAYALVESKKRINK